MSRGRDVADRSNVQRTESNWSLLAFRQIMHSVPHSFPNLPVVHPGSSIFPQTFHGTRKLCTNLFPLPFLLATHVILRCFGQARGLDSREAILNIDRCRHLL